MNHPGQAVASIRIPGGHSLHPVKNGGNFDKIADQNFPPIFTGQITPLTKLSPYRGNKPKIDRKT